MLFLCHAMKWPPLQRFFYAACKEQLTDLNGRRLPGLPRLSIVHLIGAAIRQPTIQTHPNRLTGSKTEWGRRPCTASGRAWCTLSPLVVAHRSTPRGGSVRGGGHAQPTILSRTAPFPWEGGGYGRTLVAIWIQALRHAHGRRWTNMHQGMSRPRGHATSGIV